MTTNTTNAKQIAEFTAKTLWRTGGKALGHLSVLYGAYKLLGRPSKKSDDKKEGVMKRVSRLAVGNATEAPLAKRWAKKVLGLGAAEAILADESVQAPIEATWKRLEPIAVKFMTPIIQTLEEPVLDSLSEAGLIRHYGSFTEELKDKMAAKFKPDWMTRLGDYLKGVQGGYQLLQAGSEVEKGLTYLEQNAPKAGQTVADAMVRTAQVGSQAVEFIANTTQVPSQLLSRASDLLEDAGISPGASAALMAGIGIGATAAYGIYTLFGSRMSQTQSQQATAAASGNNFTVVFEGKKSSSGPSRSA